MSSSPEQITFSQIIESQTQTEKPSSFQTIRNSFTGNRDADTKPPYDPDFSIPDESDPDTFPENQQSQRRLEFINAIINYYEMSLNQHANDNPKSQATKRANLDAYRSLQNPNVQDDFFESLDKETKTEFNRLAEEYSDTNSEEKKKKLRQTARKIIKSYFASQA